MAIIDLPTIDLSKIKLPFELPSVDLPSIDLSGVDVPNAEQIIEWLRDAVYAGTGLAALTAERVAELQKSVVQRVTSQLKR
jgi:hypothetical protein